MCKVYKSKWKVRFSSTVPLQRPQASGAPPAARQRQRRHAAQHRRREKVWQQADARDERVTAAGSLHCSLRLQCIQTRLGVSPPAAHVSHRPRTRHILRYFTATFTRQVYIYCRYFAATIPLLYRCPRLFSRSRVSNESLPDGQRIGLHMLQWRSSWRRFNSVAHTVSEGFSTQKAATTLCEAPPSR